jgi:Pili and flagellar-assembly chaperone, PapD N-terminal domain
MPKNRHMLLAMAGKTTGAMLALVALGLPCSALVGASAPVPPAPGSSLVVTPTRIVLEGRARSAEIFLHNSGNAPGTYRISVVEMEMDEHGRTTENPAPPGATSAANLLRYSPRQVVLAPGTSQTVRVQIRKPEHLAAGEYRCHFLFRAVPDTAAAEPAPDFESSIGVSIKAIYGVSIPFILRHGPVQVKASLSDLSLAPEGTALSFQINREGNRSLYGDLQATWQPRNGKPVPAGKLNGVAVYANLPLRKFTLPLSGLKVPALPGILKVSYLESGSRKIIAEALLELK